MTQDSRKKRVLGYSDKLSVRPGERIEFKISSEDGGQYTAQLVQLINGDVHSTAASYKEVEIDSPINGRYRGRQQPVRPGSCIVVDSVNRLDTAREMTVVISFMPTTPRSGMQRLIGRWDAARRVGWSLHINERGRLEFSAADQRGTVSSLEISEPLAPKDWYAAALRVSWPTRTVRLECRRFDGAPHIREPMSCHATINELGRFIEVTCPLLMAAAFGGHGPSGQIVPVDCFNGRLEAPAIYDGILSDDELTQVIAGNRPESLAGALIADWDFSIDISSIRIADRSANKLDGYAHNLPLRAVRGTAWDGSTMEWRHAPYQYAAIHFHDDDLHDCGWLTDIVFTIPADCASGIYALRLRSANEDGADRLCNEDHVAFFVAAAKDAPTSKLAFIVPTYSYLAYGNVRLLEAGRRASGQSQEQYYARSTTGPGTKEYALLIEEHGDLGLSLYDSHADGSPVHFSSWLRPLLTMRPKSMLLGLSADLLLIDWLETKGFDYDVITDDLLQREGVDLLKNYRAVMTGNHPEYQTTQQLDAIQAYLSQGGRWMYLGGNGYYWRTAVHEALPGTVEVRRGRTGSGTWQSEVGESCLAFSGEMGSIWRDLGRPPQSLMGVGWIATGPDPSYYRIVAEAKRSRAGFILEGVEGELVGDFGVFGGAAGQEIDKTSAARGTPPNTIILARSEKHGPGMLYAVEEMRSSHPVIDTYRPLTCGEIVFFETRKGGAVFSVGSMAWCGSLSHNGYDNNVSTITENVLVGLLSEALPSSSADEAQPVQQATACQCLD